MIIQISSTDSSSQEYCIIEYQGEIQGNITGDLELGSIRILKVSLLLKINSPYHNFESISKYWNH
jgi:hypothetical protein